MRNFTALFIAIFYPLGAVAKFAILILLLVGLLIVGGIGVTCYGLGQLMLWAAESLLGQKASETKSNADSYPR